MFLKMENYKEKNNYIKLLNSHFEKLKNPRSYGSNDKNTQKIFDTLSETLPVDDMEKYNIEKYKEIIEKKYEEIKNLSEKTRNENNEKDSKFKSYYLNIKNSTNYTQNRGFLQVIVITEKVEKEKFTDYRFQIFL
jgi:hypothetical protein